MTAGTATQERVTPVRETAEQQDMELWENSTAGRVQIERFNQQGALVPELINGHRKFHILPQERRINQEKAATPGQDVFQNGVLQPVSLNPDEPDTAALMANPNVLPEAEQRVLFRAKPADFKARLAGITHAPALNRLLEVAVEVDASIGQYRAIEARLEEIAPLLVTEIQSRSTAGAEEGRRATAVSPR